MISEFYACDDCFDSIQGMMNFSCFSYFLWKPYLISGISDVAKNVQLLNTIINANVPGNDDCSFALKTSANKFFVFFRNLLKKSPMPFTSQSTPRVKFNKDHKPGSLSITFNWVKD